MGLYQNNDGVLAPIAGRGKAEYGASTIRKGTIPVNTITGDWQANVVFDTPMPDDDYIVVLDTYPYTIASILPISNKTANGFSVYCRNVATPTSGSYIYYTAFKLYTDNEYNNLLKITRPDLWPVDTEIDFGDGLYGKRYTGIWNGAGTSVLLDNSIKSPNCKLIDYKVWQQRRGGSNDYLQLLGCNYNDGGTISILLASTAGLYISHNWPSASDYDIWVTYTKTT